MKKQAEHHRTRYGILYPLMLRFSQNVNHFYMTLTRKMQLSLSQTCVTWYMFHLALKAFKA